MFDVYEAIDDIINDINEDYYESCYDAIYEELCDRVEYGELPLEEAEMINEAAAEKYITEFNSDIKRHYDNRLAKERLTHNHDQLSRNGGYLRFVPPNKHLRKSEYPLDSYFMIMTLILQHIKILSAAVIKFINFNIIKTVKKMMKRMILRSNVN